VVEALADAYTSPGILHRTAWPTSGSSHESGMRATPPSPRDLIIRPACAPVWRSRRHERFPLHAQSWAELEPEAAAQAAGTEASQTEDAQPDALPDEMTRIEAAAVMSHQNQESSDSDDESDSESQASD
jgi:hypothetical protein